jgi:carbamoyltransferase
MKILGFNPNHHGSICLLEDGKLKFFIQEERIGIREKYSDFPIRSFIEILNSHKIDYITWGSPSIFYTINSLNPRYTYWEKIVKSFGSTPHPVDFSRTYHHICHVSHTFYNSGFKKAIGVVIDGLGSEVLNKDNKSIGQETETIYECSYPFNFDILYKNISLNNSEVNLSQAYETLTMHLGWDRDEAGKTMGLAPYGKYNQNFPTFFQKNKTNPNVFYTDHNKITYLPNQDFTFINDTETPQLKLQRDPREWHYDESKITDLEKDLAWKIQNDTQQLVGDYIEKAIKETGLKQVCCAGGYFLNCVTNYYLIKRFPDVEFYFEPIANDAGTAIGSAKLLWYILTQDTTIRPLKSIYLGKQYSKEELLKGIKKYD